ncbi:hypothetical protein CC78DRAFT_531919 [Lojkania enalia]|uniref:Dpy-30 domain-containing protein n=1 Tax=Lojkania enalia TaxID=147567 RepID=A0A9P4KH57_9PLEO|nr:hypothetical protein CC78DRAFT_531919 [Didymosphaeria enalia]
MAEPSPNPQPSDTPASEPILTPIPNGTTAAPDIEMTDSTPQDASASVPTDSILPPNPFQSPPHPSSTPTATPTATQPSAPTPQPAPSHTPSRNSPHPSGGVEKQAPSQPNPHGSPTRVYLNQNVTPHLLDAMKHLVTQEFMPEKPLKWLSEYLAQKSYEVEGP